MTDELDDALENQFAPDFDDAGNVKGGSVTRSGADYLAARRLLLEAANRWPIDEADIVSPGMPTITTEVRDAAGNVVAIMTTIDYTQPQPEPYTDDRSRTKRRRAPR